MQNKLSNGIAAILCSVLPIGLAAQSAQDQAAFEGKRSVQRMASDIYKQIVTLPQYGVFDHLHFAIQGGTVILRGTLPVRSSNPARKCSEEDRGCSGGPQRIEVLPVSPNDDRIRALATAKFTATHGLAVTQATGV